MCRQQWKEGEEEEPEREQIKIRKTEREKYDQGKRKKYEKEKRKEYDQQKRKKHGQTTTVATVQDNRKTAGYCWKK